MSKIVTILVSTIGPSVGPFSVYSIDLAGNETGPLNTIPLTRAELLSGYTLTNVPDNAVSLIIDSLSADCPVTINVAIDGPLITTTTTSTTSTTTAPVGRPSGFIMYDCTGRSYEVFSNCSEVGLGCYLYQDIFNTPVVPGIYMLTYDPDYGGFQTNLSGLIINTSSCF